MHQLFLKNQENNDFALEYMNMLGHQNSKVIKINFKDNLSNNTNINSLDYWLDVWINYYNHLKNLFHTIIYILLITKIFVKSKFQNF